MRTVKRQWLAVEPGMYVKDRTGKTWRVEDERDGRLLLVGAGGERTTMQRPPATQHVDVLEPTDEEALALVKRELGGSVVAVAERDRVMRCPPLTRVLDDIHAHMFLIHGIYTRSGPGSKGIDKLLEFHKQDHLNEAERSHAWLNHEHHREIG